MQQKRQLLEENERAEVTPSNVWRPHLLVVCSCVSILTGCGPGNELGRVPIVGVVTLDGQPLDQGSISFEPIGDGTSSGATIETGAFKIPEEKGLPPGRYLVRVYSAAESKAAPADQPPGESGAVSKERIPKSWNANSEQEVEISGDSASELKFDIKSSG